MIHGILLAAGEGSRFGGRKLLATLPEGVAMVSVSAHNLLAGVDKVLAVVRAGDNELIRLLEHEGLQVVPCPQAHLGMAYSIACGVSATARSDGWVIALADMPFIHPDTVRAVSNALRTGALLAAPFYHGRRGHPVGFAAALRNELEALRGEQGACTLVKRHGQALVRLYCDDPGILLDIDTPAELPDD